MVPTSPLATPFVLLCAAVLATACGGGGAAAPPAAPPTLLALQDQVQVVGETARFDARATSPWPAADLRFDWTLRREQSDRPYVPSPVYDTTQSAGPSLAFVVPRAGSWAVALTVTDPAGARATATARLIGRHTFIDNGDGTATNQQTGLTWQLADDGNRYTLAEARGRAVLSAGDNNGLDMCGNLVLGGHDDWRVPTLPEAGSLLDFTFATLPVAEPMRATTRSQSFHLSDSWVPNSKVDWIGTSDGAIAHQDATDRTYLRCVRP